MAVRVHHLPEPLEPGQRRRPRASQTTDTTERRRPKAVTEAGTPRPIEPAIPLDDSIVTAFAHLLTDRQVDVMKVLGSNQRHTCLVGGSRSGKTTLLVRAVIIRALKVKSRHAILRFRSNAIWPSIGMDTFPKVMKTFFPKVRFTTNKSMHFFELENGSQIWLGGLDDAERTEKILGNEYSTVYFNECSQIPYSSVLMALSRLAEQIEGLSQKAYYDLNPSSTRHWSNLLFGDHVDPVTNRPLANPEAYERAFMNPSDNKVNLSIEYLQSLDSMPERHRKRFRDGVYVDEADDALWKLATLAACRRTSLEVPRLIRVVVAVDPSGAKNQFDTSHDAIGIMIVGLGDDGHAYVLSDRTMLGGPEEWARTAVMNYHTFKCDCIVAEINYGGAMVEHTLRTIDQSIPYKQVTASRGKTVRAEPVASLYEQGKVHHVEKVEEADLYGMKEGGFAELEDELASFTVLGYVGPKSPNRADALVWAISELMLAENAAGFVEYYKRMAEGTLNRGQAPATNMGEVLRAGQPNAPQPNAPLPPDTPVVQTAPHRQFCLPMPNGRNEYITATADGLITVKEPSHLSLLLGQGCVRV